MSKKLLAAALAAAFLATGGVVKAADSLEFTDTGWTFTDSTGPGTGTISGTDDITAVNVPADSTKSVTDGTADGKGTADDLNIDIKSGSTSTGGALGAVTVKGTGKTITVGSASGVIATATSVVADDSGVLTIGDGSLASSLTVSGTTTVGGTVAAAGGIVVAAESTYVANGAVTIDNTSSINNSGTFSIGGTLTDGGTGTNTFTNAGTVNVLGTSSATAFNTLAGMIGGNSLGTVNYNIDNSGATTLTASSATSGELNIVQQTAAAKTTVDAGTTVDVNLNGGTFGAVTAKSATLKTGTSILDSASKKVILEAAATGTVLGNINSTGATTDVAVNVKTGNTNTNTFGTAADPDTSTPATTITGGVLLEGGNNTVNGDVTGVVVDGLTTYAVKTNAGSINVFNGEVKGNFLAVDGTNTINNDVTGDLIVTAGKTTIAGKDGELSGSGTKVTVGSGGELVNAKVATDDPLTTEGALSLAGKVIDNTGKITNNAGGVIEFDFGTTGSKVGSYTGAGRIDNTAGGVVRVDLDERVDTAKVLNALMDESTVGTVNLHSDIALVNGEDINMSAAKGGLIDTTGLTTAVNGTSVNAGTQASLNLGSGLYKNVSGKSVSAGVAGGPKTTIDGTIDTVDGKFVVNDGGVGATTEVEFTKGTDYTAVTDLQIGENDRAPTGAPTNLSGGAESVLTFAQDNTDPMNIVPHTYDLENVAVKNFGTLDGNGNLIILDSYTRSNNTGQSVIDSGVAAGQYGSEDVGIKTSGAAGTSLAAIGNDLMNNGAPAVRDLQNLIVSDALANDVNFHDATAGALVLLDDQTGANVNIGNANLFINGGGELGTITANNSIFNHDMEIGGSELKTGVTLNIEVSDPVLPGYTGTVTLKSGTTLQAGKDITFSEDGNTLVNNSAALVLQNGSNINLNALDATIQNNASMRINAGATVADLTTSQENLNSAKFNNYNTAGANPGPGYLTIEGNNATLDKYGEMLNRSDKVTIDGVADQTYLGQVTIDGNMATKFITADADAGEVIVRGVQGHGFEINTGDADLTIHSGTFANNTDNSMSGAISGGKVTIDGQGHYTGVVTGTKGFELDGDNNEFRNTVTAITGDVLVEGDKNLFTHDVEATAGDVTIEGLSNEFKTDVIAKKDADGKGGNVTSLDGGNFQDITAEGTVLLEKGDAADRYANVKGDVTADTLDSTDMVYTGGSVDVNTLDSTRDTFNDVDIEVAGDAWISGSTIDSSSTLDIGGTLHSSGNVWDGDRDYTNLITSGDTYTGKVTASGYALVGYDFDKNGKLVQKADGSTFEQTLEVGAGPMYSHNADYQGALTFGTIGATDAKDFFSSEDKIASLKINSGDAYLGYLVTGIDTDGKEIFEKANGSVVAGAFESTVGNVNAYDSDFLGNVTVTKGSLASEGSEYGLFDEDDKVLGSVNVMVADGNMISRGDLFTGNVTVNGADGKLDSEGSVYGLGKDTETNLAGQVTVKELKSVDDQFYGQVLVATGDANVDGSYFAQNASVLLGKANLNNVTIADAFTFSSKGDMTVTGDADNVILGNLVSDGKIDITSTGALFGDINATGGATLMAGSNASFGGNSLGRFTVADSAQFNLVDDITIDGDFKALDGSIINFDYLSDGSTLAMFSATTGGTIDLGLFSHLTTDATEDVMMTVFDDTAVDALTIDGSKDQELLESYLEAQGGSSIIGKDLFGLVDGEIVYNFKRADNDDDALDEVLKEQGISGDRDMITADSVSGLKDAASVTEAEMLELEENDPQAAYAVKLIDGASGRGRWYNLKNNPAAAYAVHQWMNGKDWAGAVEAVTDTVRNFNRAITNRAYNIGHLFGSTQYDECGNIIDSCAGFQNRIWAGYTGMWGKNDGRDYDRGYKYDAHGLNVGYDRITSSGVGFGAAFGYSRGDYENRGAFNWGDKSKLHNYSFGLFASYNHTSGFFTTLSGTYTYTKYKMNNGMVDASAFRNPNDIGALTDRADFHGDSWSFGGKMGYDIRPATNLTITPTLGVYYYGTRTSRFDTSLGRSGMKYSRHTVEMPLDVTVKYDIAVGCDSTLSLIATGGYAYNFHNKGTNISTFNIAGIEPEVGGGRFVKPGRSSWNVGAGAQFRYRNIDFGVNYEYYGRKDYKSHSLNANVGYSF